MAKNTFFKLLTYFVLITSVAFFTASVTSAQENRQNPAVTSLLAGIADLLNQLTALTAKIVQLEDSSVQTEVQASPVNLPNLAPPAAVQPSSSQTSNESTPAPIINRTLSKGSQGADVKALQNYLRAVGIFQGETTENYLSKTEAAVKKFQAQNGIEPTGILGPITRSALNNSGSGSGGSIGPSAAQKYTCPFKESLPQKNYFNTSGERNTQAEADTEALKSCKEEKEELENSRIADIGQMAIDCSKGIPNSFPPPDQFPCTPSQSFEGATIGCKGYDSKHYICKTGQLLEICTYYGGSNSGNCVKSPDVRCNSDSDSWVSSASGSTAGITYTCTATAGLR